jgi:ribosomal protein L29
MKKTSYTGQDTKDLHKALYEKRNALHKFNFGKAGASAKNVKEGRLARKEIARIMTELNRNK